MRILFVSNLYPPHELGGMELRCRETVEALQTRGHTCHVLTSRFGACGQHSLQEDVSRTLYLQADVQYYRPLGFFLRRPWQEKANARALRRTLEDFQPDLVFVWGMWNLSYRVAYWAEQLLPGRVAYAVASYWLAKPDVHEAYWQHPARRPWARLLLAPARWLAQRILARERGSFRLGLEQVACVSEYVRRKLVTAGALPNGARVIYNGIDPQPFLQAATRRTSDGDKMHLIYTGGILPHKGLHTAIEAMDLLQRDGDCGDAHLTLVGSGHTDYVAYLKKRVSLLGLDEKVTFHGRVPRNRIPALLGDSDAFLFTSVWEEPMARSVMEAMASGLAVVGTPVGGQSEMLHDGVNALVFPPADAASLAHCIQRLHRDPDLRTRLAEAGQRTIVERFTLKRMVDETESWLISICQCA